MIPKTFLTLTIGAMFVVIPACILHAQWVQTSEPDPEGIQALAVSDSNLYAGTATTDVLYSVNNGTSWTTDDSGLTPLSAQGEVTALVANGSNLFAGTLGSGIYFSSNDGTSWTEADSGLTNLDLGVEAITETGTKLFAGTWGGVFLSSNNGTNWTASSDGLPSSAQVWSLAVIGNNVFAGTNDTGVYLSTDSGSHWAAVNNGLPSNSTINCFVVADTILYAGTWNGVFLSTNFGTSWMPANSGLDTVVWALAVKGANLFAGTSAGVFLSTNNGSSWNAVNNGFPQSPTINVLAVNDEYLFAGFFGVWRRPLSDFVISAVSSSPTSISNSIQSFPNPFSQSTTISFTPETSGYADISIVNLLGSEVAHLYSGELAAGEHSFLWSNPTGLPDGTYECLVRMNGQVQTLSMALMR